MHEMILEKLRKIEKRQNITVLLAVETGSRAWGYANDNSDYDICFMYKQNDISRYLVLDKYKDVYSENDGMFDFTGWDVKKALYLHFKSNPNMREWIISPVKYIPDETGIFKDLPDFNPKILKPHYFGLASKTNKKYIEGSDLRDVKIVKKTLYVIRCTLAWQLIDRGMLPPVDFDELIKLNELESELKEAILNLKESYSHLTIDNVSKEDLNLIHLWINDSLDKFSIDKIEYSKRSIDDYNRRFQQIIGLI